MTPETAKFKRPWYNVNFSNDLYFNGKTTRFLRIAIPPHNKDHTTEENPPDPRSYWATILPVYSYAQNKKIENGFLYNWYAVNDSRGLVNNINGWRIPTDNDWKNLEKYVDKDLINEEEWDNDGMRGYLIARRLKSLYEWDQTTPITNDFNFSALPGGYRDFETSELQNDAEAYWNFNEIGGDTVYDQGDNGKHGTIIGNVKRVEGRYDKALKFDGSGRVDTNYKIENLNFTISLWVEPTDNNDDNSTYLLNQHNPGAPDNGLFLIQNKKVSGTPDINKKTISFLFNNVSSSEIELTEKENHVLFGRRDDNEFFIRVNGVEKWTETNIEDIPDGIIQIGGSDIDDRNSKSIIDDVRIYSRGLTNEEGDLLYKGEFKNLKEKCYWWTSSEFKDISPNSEAWCRMLTKFDGYDQIGRFSESKKQGFGVRCVRDFNEKIDSELKDGDFGKNYVGNDGTKYKTVRIGNQIWTAENLIETEWRDHTKIEPFDKNLEGYWIFDEKTEVFVYNENGNENDYWVKINQNEQASFSIYENKKQNAYLENNLLNRDFETSQFLINGVDIKPMYENTLENLRTFDCFNIYGRTQNLLFGNMYNHFKCLPLSYWQEIKEGDSWEYRIDYLGKENENVKFVLFISEFRPTINEFVHGHDSWRINGSKLQNEPPIPDTLSPNEEIIPYSLKYSKYGIKSINDYLFSHENFDSVSLEAGKPYYKEPHLPYKIDYIDIDIYGNKFSKETLKENVSEFNNDDKILYDNKTSHLLLRTNPRLSGNVKLTIDSEGKLWLNSIDANDELSDVKFKKYKVAPYSVYSADLYRFFDNGKTPSDVIFDLREYDDSYQYSKTEYHLQYDNFYGYGTKQVESQFYDEKLSLFAPMWLKKQIPEFFVVFKVDHSISKSTYKNLENKEILDELLKNAIILKTFDLREGTNIGQYLRGIVNERNFKEQPLYITFDKESLSKWNGASIRDGSVSEKGEYLYDIFSKDRTIKEFEEHITLGFMRNDIICQNLINLEFLFNDDVSEEYSINRYFGLYVNEIELDRFDVNEKILTQLKDQTPKAELEIDIYEASMIPFEQTNKNGIILPVKESNQKYLNVDYDSKDELSKIIKDKNKFFTVKNKSSEFKRIKEISNKTFDKLYKKFNYKEIKLYDKKLDITQFVGIDKFSVQHKAELIDDAPSQLVISLYDTEKNKLIIEPGEILTICWEQDNDYHEWQMIANETGLERGEWWNFPIYNDDVDAYQNTFNPRGTPEQVAESLAGCINEFKENFVAYANNNKIYIASKLKFEGANNFKFTRNLIDNSSVVENLLFYDIIPEIKYSEGTPQDVYCEQNFIGGNSRRRNRAKLTEETGNNIEVNDWFQRQRKSFAQLEKYRIGDEFVHILPYLDEPKYDPRGNFIGFKDMDDYVIIELEENREFYTNHESYIIAYKTFSPVFSMLSVNPIKDFDFDFFYSKYSYAPVAELLKYFEFFELSSGDSDDFIELPKNEFFKILDGIAELEGLINENWEKINIDLDSSEYETSIFNTLDKSLKFNYDTRLYETVNVYERFRLKRKEASDLKIVKFSYSEKNLESYQTKERDILSRDNIDYNILEFPGFSGLEDIYNEHDENAVNEFIKNEDFRRYTYSLLSSEYERLLENNLKDHVLKSRVVPYINKWVNIGTDVHDNKYRLNISRAFGVTNFSPVEDIVSDPSLFTHEWYYLDRHPDKYPKDLMINSRSYMFTSLNDIPFENSNKISEKYSNKTWKELLYDTDVDFFTKYFTVGYPSDSVKNSELYRPREERFVFTEFIEGLDEIQCLFRGARLRIDELDELGNRIEGSDFYRDYKFAAILTLKEQSDFEYTKPYEIEIIDNRKFKCITFVISVFLQDYKFNNFLDYVSLYTTNSAQKNDNIFNGVIPDLDVKDYDSNISNIKYDYNKSLGNRFIVINDYKDIEINSQISRSSHLRYDIDNSRLKNIDFNKQEIEKINSGSLQNVYALINDPVYYGKITSFEGFLSILSKEPSLDISLPTVVVLLVDSLLIMGRYDIARILRFSSFYPNQTNLNLTTNQILIDSAADILNTNIYTRALIYLKGYNTTEFDSTDYTPNNRKVDLRQVYMLNSGKDYNSEILEKISFNNIKNLINEKHESVNYISIDEDNKILKNQFSLNFIDPVETVKSEILRTKPDTNKPAELKTHKTIGYDLETVDSYEKIQRYGGNYEPLKRDIVLFNLNENNDLINYFNKDFTLLNTSININNENSGIIKNLSINKVNKEEILKVTDSLAYMNVYPLVGHVSIDNKNHNIALSSWDNNFYRNYIEKTRFDKVEGLVELKEIKSFIGSKAMNVPILFELDSFNDDEFDIRFIKPTGSNIGGLRNPITIDEGKPKVILTIDLKKRLKRRMFDDNANKEFKWIRENIESSLKNLSDIELNLIVDEYLEKNILKLYEIDSLVVYSRRRTRDIKLDVQDKDYKLERYCKFDFSKDLKEILNQFYQEDKSYKFEVDENNPLKAIITIDLNTNEFRSFSLHTRVMRI